MICLIIKTFCNFPVGCNTAAAHTVVAHIAVDHTAAARIAVGHIAVEDTAADDSYNVVTAKSV